ncbi:Response regulator of zinc sigma-54-dependent two-component system [Olavius algarvensis Delta 1 endosymbiont]|nr:Response regulator of zinc sigma-54-dependent two-component system [Olavius algarvensis Delta 1 endosymbiont]
MASILIVDDEPDIRELLEGEFSDLGHRIETAGSAKDALTLGGAKLFDVVFLDIRMPDGSGLEILPELRNGPGEPEIIIMTAYGDPDGAELAVKGGAWDYLEKPVSIDHFTLTLQRAIRFREQASLAGSMVVMDHDKIVAESPQMRACLELVTKAARTQANVLISGETGTGKELIANLIHRNSPRANKPFVVVDCASLPENLVESTLFGHEKGAFTGADKSRSGLLQEANHGTLFLDEIGELPYTMQKRFLRVLQEHRYRPVGGTREQTSDFRLLAATNRNLAGMIEKGTFRQDLMFRLKTYNIELPPLRDRLQDIKALIIHFANKLCQRFGIAEKGFSQDFFQTLEAYDWPGNVRELSNTMEMVLAQAYDEPILFAKHLPVDIRAKSIKSIVSRKIKPESAKRERRKDATATIGTGKIPTFRDYRDDHLAKIEKEYLHILLAKTGGNHKKALRTANLARTRLYELLKKHGLSIKN